MPPAIDLTGQKFTRLAVIRRLPERMGSSVIWLCKCDCGKSVKAPANGLRSGNYKSCGCWRADSAKSTFTKHRQSGSPEFISWQKAKQRCTNPRNKSWAKYGGRGIAMCDRWLHSFEAFLSDMGERPSATHSIDRIDANGNYTPLNCRWATPAQQRRNQRTRIVKVRVDGEVLCLTDAAGRAGINHSTVRARIGRGWSINRALSTPVHGAGR